MATSPFSSSYAAIPRLYSATPRSKYSSFYSGGGGPGWSASSGGGTQYTTRQQLIKLLAAQGKGGSGFSFGHLLHGASGPLRGALGVTGAALDAIMRPSYGMAAGTDAYLTQGSVESFMRGLKSGLTGKTKEGFGQVLQHHGVLKGHRTLRGLTGFGLDVVTDPTMLLSLAGAPETGGASLAAYEAAKASGEAVSKELVTKAAREAGQLAIKGDHSEIVGQALKDGGDKFKLRLSKWEQNKVVHDLAQSKENPFLLQHAQQAARTESDIRSVGALAEAKKYNPRKVVAYYGTRKHNIHIPLFPSIADPGEKLAERQIPILSNIAGSLGRKFSPGFTDKALFKMELARQHAAEQGYVNLQRMIKENFAKVHLGDPQKELDALHYFEQPLQYGKSKRKWAAVLKTKEGFSTLNPRYVQHLLKEGYITPEQAAFVQTYQHATQTLLQFEKAAGVNVTHLAGNRMYVPHVTLRNGQSAAQTISQAGLTVEAGFQKMRKGQKLSVKQIAEMVNHNPALNGIETDPIKLLLTRARSSAERQADMGLIHSLAAGVGVPLRKVNKADVARGMQRFKTAAANEAAATKYGAVAEQAYHDAVQNADALVRSRHNANLRALTDMKKAEEAKLAEQAKAAKAAPKTAARTAAPKTTAKATKEARIAEAVKAPVAPEAVKNAGTRVRNATINVARNGSERIITLEHGGDTLAKVTIESPGRKMGWAVKDIAVHPSFREAGAGQRAVLLAKQRFPSLKFDKKQLEDLTAARELKTAEPIKPVRTSGAPVEKAGGAGKRLVPKPTAASKAADTRARAAIKSAEVTSAKKGAERVVSLVHGKTTIGSVTLQKQEVGWGVKELKIHPRYTGKGAGNRLLFQAKRKFPGLKYDKSILLKDKAPVAKAAEVAPKAPPVPKGRAPKPPGRIPALKPVVDTTKLDKINAEIAKAKADFPKLKAAANNPETALHKELFKEHLDNLRIAQETKSLAQQDMAKAQRFLKEARLGKKNKAYNKALHTIIPSVKDEFGNPIAFPHHAANTSMKLQRLISGDDQEVKNFTRTVAKWMSAWKVMVTSVNPGYRIRNTMTDLWNMWLARVPAWAVGTYGAKAAHLMKAAANGDPKAMDLMLEMGHHGILAGLFGGDIQTASKIARGMEGGGHYLRRGNIPKAWVRYTQTVNRNAENWGRITHYLYRKQALKESAAEAAHAVKMAHFDYSELTPFEQNTMKNIFPFYTWSRKNIPYQVKKILSEPGRYSAFPKLVNEATYAAGDPKEPVPNYLTQAMAFPIPLPGGKHVYYSPQFGVSDLQPFESAGAAEQRALGLVSPFIKTPFELAANKNLFSGQPIASDKHPRVPVTGLGAALLSLLPGSNVGQTARTSAAGVTTGPGANPYYAYLLGQTPLTRMLGVSGFGGMTGKKNNIAGVPASVVSWLAGQSMTNVNPQDQNYFAQLQLQNEADKILQGLKDAGVYKTKKRKKSRFDKAIQAQLRAQYGG